MKTISTELETHLAQEVTTMCTCWLLVKLDGTFQGFTNHTSDILYDIVELSYGEILFEASTGFTPSNISSTEDLAVDNMEVVGLLDSNSISRDALIAGEYDQAEVYNFMLNYEDLTMGDLKLSYGTIGEVKSGRVVFEAEFRGLSQKLDQKIGEVYSVTCRADLGDVRCKVSVTSDTWVGRELVSSGDYRRATLANSTNKRFLATTEGYTSSQEPSWDIVEGNTTNELDLEILDDGAFDNTLGIKWFADGPEWSWSAGIVSCDGSQTANTNLTQSSSEFLNQMVSATPYSISFDVLNYVAGNVRIVVDGVAGAWRSTDNTHTEDMTISGTSLIAIEGDVDFEGDIDNISVIEKTDVVYTTKSSWLQIGTITTVNSNENFEDTGRSEVDNYFDRGFFTFTTGANAGHSREIKTFASDTFQLALPFPYDVQVGDKYEVYRGCDKTTSDCKTTFGNIINFRGEPFIPGIDEVSRFGGQ